MTDQKKTPLQPWTRLRAVEEMHRTAYSAQEIYDLLKPFHHCCLDTILADIVEVELAWKKGKP